MPAPESGERWGILGGLFDPVHFGHLNLARQTATQAKLDGVIFLPSYNPPHRSGKGHTDFDGRVAMLKLAMDNHPNFVISEIERSIKHTGYTYDTILKLKQESPGVEFHFIVGSDNLNILTEWYKWKELLDEVLFLVGIRPGVENQLLDLLPQEKRIRIKRIDFRPVELSSTEIRKKVNEGVNSEYLREFVPASVADYIIREELYV